ncbi:MAG: HAMP domain-containing sensor histidine kinase, partial [Acidobacteriota bacterium]
PDGSRYLVRIVDRQDALVFQTGDATIRTRDAVDASAQLFALLPADQLARAGLDAELASFRRPEPEPRGRGGRRFGEGRRLSRIYPLISSPEQARWRLLVNHPEGSLDAVVARAHRNNLAISFGILLLLATSLLLMLLSTRRLQALAKQQLEFIAGVTHELLTPLAAMRSAGQNLADGVVSEPAQVQRYGRLIEDEGRRLTGMVGQVLEFAGMQAGRKTYSLRPADPGEILTRALDEYRPMLEEKAFEIETHLDDSLPRIPADPPALHRAIQNLIANAIKYGADGAWIGLEARRSEKPHGSGVTLTVADRGPGIAAADRPRLFEPFFRGRNVADEQIPGSGLGLSLVQHIVEGHGGSVRVETEEGQGSRFILWLPAKEGDHE